MKKHDSQHHVAQKRKQLKDRNWIPTKTHHKNAARLIDNRKRKEERRQSRQKYILQNHFLDD